MKDAYEVARTAGTLGPELNLLSQVTMNVAKQVRTDTDIGRNPVSVAYAAVSLARQIFTNLSEKSALLLGAGETVELVAEHLRAAGIGRMTIANRTLVHAEALAIRVGATAIQLSDMPRNLAQHDVVIASTASTLPVLGKGAVEAALKARKRKPMFMVDIAVPRDIEPEVGTLDDVYLYSIDDLTEIIETNLGERRRAAESAEALIVEGTDRYFREKRIRDGQHLLRTFRARAEATQLTEVERATARLANGEDPRLVAEQLARALTQKLLHEPTIAIREASADGRNDLLNYLRAIYGIDAD
ncbi:MAG: glutamyl-tRNA reductase [Gammaproteobacteria bacterium]|nr:glutamyl-tRNA reductase [Gammaproteobacteria bacterium]